MEDTTMKKAAMSAVRGICTRLRHGADTAHAGDIRSARGTTVPVAGTRGRDVRVADLRTAVARTLAPVPAVGYPRLEAPPV